MSLKKTMAVMLAAALLPAASMAEIVQLDAAPQEMKGTEAQQVFTWPGSVSFDANMLAQEGAPVEHQRPNATQKAEMGENDAPVIDALTQIFIDGFAPGWDANWTGPYGGGYDSDGNFHSWTWSERTERQSVGDYAIYCSGDATEVPDPQTDTYGDDMVTWIKYGPVDMSGHEGAGVMFDAYIDCEPTFDNLFVGISTDGVNFDGSFYSGYDAVWHTDEYYQIDFPGGATEVYFLFKFKSDYAVSPSEGVWVDQVRLYGYNPGPLPDLRIIDVSWSPMNPAAGANVDVTVNYINVGAGDAGPFYIDLFSDTDGVFPSIGELGTFGFYNSGLAAGTSASHTFTTSYPSNGTRWLAALIDTDQIVDETNESNNTWGFEKLPVGIATIIWAGVVSPYPVPAAGATITYPVSATQYTSPQTRPAWVTISYEGYGNSVEVFKTPGNITLNPGGTLNTNLSHYIPGNAPGGNYMINVNFGNYPWIPWDSGVTTFWKDGPVANSLRDFDGVEFKTIGTNAFDVAAEDELSLSSNLPTEFAMGTAYPNPFNPSTTISLALPETAELNVNVFNVQGQLVATLASGQYQAGNHQMVFNANGLASGVYLVQAQANTGEAAVQKVMLMK
ncbi:T9SS type A sorting domain-containing protein [bacterium]|nr:T9SS type A sorting domain-containing protein [bacterium]